MWVPLVYLRSYFTLIAEGPRYPGQPQTPEQAFGLTLRTLEALALRSGYHATYIGQPERGTQSLSLSTPYRLARTLLIPLRNSSFARKGVSTSGQSGRPKIAHVRPSKFRGPIDAPGGIGAQRCDKRCSPSLPGPQARSLAGFMRTERAISLVTVFIAHVTRS